MKDKKYQNILCFGEILWDMLPSGAQPGGAPLNVAIHLIRQGQRPALISKIGNDTPGWNLIEFITSAGLERDLIQVDEGLPTSKVNVFLNEHKNASYEICEPVAWDNIHLNNDNLDTALKADLIIFGSLASRNKTTRKTLFQLLNSTNATKLLDVNLRSPYDKPEAINELLAKADFIKLNDDELKIIAGWHKKNGDEETLTQWVSHFFQCSAVCVTRGEKGAILYIEKQLYKHPGFKINATDTVGAGDSFLASLIAQLAKNKHPQEALEYACATGAFVASQKGAVPLYTENEIKMLISQKG